MFATATLALAIAATAANGASIEPRSASSIRDCKSFSLQSWGPMTSSSDGDAVFVDPIKASKGYISQLRSQGKQVVCYISAGTEEHWRPDASKIDESEKAKAYKGFGGTETWLDITKWESLKDIMTSRIDAAAADGCTAMELDNIDCWQNACVKGASESELKTKQVEYVRWLADTVHSKGMEVGMKNAIGIFDQVADKFDFAINEQCMVYSECGNYNAFTNAGKPVFSVEYTSHDGKICSEAASDKMISIYQDGGSWKNCW